jgi:hypothetical protein
MSDAELTTGQRTGSKAMSNTPQSWEYKVVRIVEDRKFADRIADPDPAATFEIRDIDELGKEGWELVNIVKLDRAYSLTPEQPGQHDTLHSIAYFKRPVQGQYAAAATDQARA